MGIGVPSNKVKDKNDEEALVAYNANIWVITEPGYFKLFECGKCLRTILNEFEALTNLANGPIIFTCYSESDPYTSTLQYVS